MSVKRLTAVVSGRQKHARGFTMTELMTVVFIVGTMLALAGPAFKSFIGEQRLRATSADLRIAMLTARSESVKRNRNVTITPISSNWSNGWTIANPVSTLPDILNNVIDNPSIVVALDSGSTVSFRANGRPVETVDFEISVGSGTYFTQKCLKLGAGGLLSDAVGACT